MVMTDYQIKKMEMLEQQAALYGSNSTAFTEMMDYTKRIINPKFAILQDTALSDEEFLLLEKIEDCKSKGLTLKEAISRTGLNTRYYYRMLSKKQFKKEQ
jgi:hypothetical protein